MGVEGERCTALVTLRSGMRLRVDVYDADDGVSVDTLTARLRSRGLDVVNVTRPAPLPTAPPSEQQVSSTRGMMVPVHYFFTPGIGRQDEWKPKGTYKCDQTST